MQEAQYDFLHGQTDRSDFFSPAMQQLCGIMKDKKEIGRASCRERV